MQPLDTSASTRTLWEGQKTQKIVLSVAAMASLMITTVVIDYWRNKKPRDVYELLRRIEIQLNEQHEAITRILDANPEIDVPDSTRQMFSDNQ